MPRLAVVVLDPEDEEPEEIVEEIVRLSKPPKPVKKGGPLAWLLGFLVIFLSTFMLLHEPIIHPGSTDPATYPTYATVGSGFQDPVPPPPPGWPSGPPTFDVHNP